MPYYNSKRNFSKIRNYWNIKTLKAAIFINPCDATHSPLLLKHYLFDITPPHLSHYVHAFHKPRPSPLTVYYTFWALEPIKAGHASFIHHCQQATPEMDTYSADSPDHAHNSRCEQSEEFYILGFRCHFALPQLYSRWIASRPARNPWKAGSLPRVTDFISSFRVFHVFFTAEFRSVTLAVALQEQQPPFMNPLSQLFVVACSNFTCRFLFARPLPAQRIPFWLNTLVEVWLQILEKSTKICQIDL